jgi:hypothetical protein
MDDVDVGPLQDLAEIGIPIDPGPGDLKGRGQVPAIDVAYGPEDRPGVTEMAQPHAPDADDRLGQRVARCDVSRAAKDAARDDGQGGRGGRAASDELPAGDPVGMKHGTVLSSGHSRTLYYIFREDSEMAAV